MTSMLDRLTQLANSPKNKQLLREASARAQEAAARAQQWAKDPKTRAKLEETRQRAEQWAKDPKTRAKLEEARHRVFGTGRGRTP